MSFFVPGLACCDQLSFWSSPLIYPFALVTIVPFGTHPLHLVFATVSARGTYSTYIADLVQPEIPSTFDLSMSLDFHVAPY